MWSGRLRRSGDGSGSSSAGTAVCTAACPAGRTCATSRRSTHVSPREARRRTDFHLEQVGLSEYADRKVEEYSRGMKQRLHIARGLLTDPTVLFMDEPTMGLDPMGAQELRQLIPGLVEDGRTVLLTTHYMFEADQLCKTIAMINHGRLVTLGTPTEIKRGFRGNRVVEVEIRVMRPGLVEELSALEGVERVDTDFGSGLPRLMVQIGTPVRAPTAGSRR